MKRSFEPLWSPWIPCVLGHLLSLGRVRGIQASGGGWRSGPGGDHPRRRAARARMGQELGAVRGCSTHLRGKGKYDSRGKNTETWLPSPGLREIMTIKLWFGIEFLCLNIMKSSKGVHPFSKKVGLRDGRVRTDFFLSFLPCLI